MICSKSVIRFLFWSFLLGLPALEGKSAAVALPETLPIKVSCVKGVLEGDQCVLRRPSVLRCPDGFELHGADGEGVSECVAVTSRPAIGSCEEGYHPCDSNFHCCMENPEALVDGCPDEAELLDDGRCREFVPVDMAVICPEGFEPVDNKCQQSHDYDCSPLLPVLTRGPLKPRVKKPTEQTFVITQTCRDVTTVFGEPVCPEGSKAQDGAVCVVERLFEPVKICPDSEGTVENCFSLDVLDTMYTCPTSEEELVCVEKKVKVAKKSPRISALVCRCETRVREDPLPTCIRGELESDDIDSVCLTVNSPTERCAKGYELSSTEGLCRLKNKNKGAVVTPSPPPVSTPSPASSTAPESSTTQAPPPPPPPPPASPSSIVEVESTSDGLGEEETDSLGEEDTEEMLDDDMSNLRRF